MVILTLGQYIFSDLGLSPKGRGECATYSPAELASSVVSGKVDEKNPWEQGAPGAQAIHVKQQWSKISHVCPFASSFFETRQNWIAIQTKYIRNIVRTEQPCIILNFCRKDSKMMCKIKDGKKIQNSKKHVSVRTARERNSMLNPWLVDAIALCWSSY